MNVKVSGLGAEPKKVAALGICVLLAIVAYFFNRTPSGSSEPSTVPRTATGVTPQPAAHPATRQTVRANRAGQRGQAGLQEFRPSLKPKKGEEASRADIDPTLRLDLLEKLQKVGMEGGKRSLFEASATPPVQLAKVVKEPPKVIPSKIVGPQLPPPEVKPPEPVAPPVPLKFYGFVNPQRPGTKRAFFLDGDDIIVATEGQLIKNRYKIVRIGISSAVVEDTQFKSKQQTLPLVEELAG